MAAIEPTANDRERDANAARSGGRTHRIPLRWSARITMPDETPS